MATEKLRTAIAVLLSCGLFTDTAVNVDGETITNGAPAAPSEPDQFEASGWSFNNASDLGGIKSKGVEALRVELIAKGYAALAAPTFLPTFHIIEFWRDRDPHEGFSQRDPDRYAKPADAHGLSDAQVQALIDNVVNLCNGEFVSTIGGAHIADLYRGEINGKPPGFVMAPSGQPDFSPAPAPGYKPAAALTADRGPGQVAQHYKHDDRNGYDHVTAVGEPALDHWIYDPWWKGTTDEDVTRFWRAQCIAKGARIALNV